MYLYAYFSVSPILSHELIVTRIGRYLLETKEKGLICEVDKLKGLECFVDTNFAGSWNQQDLLNPENVLS